MRVSACKSCGAPVDWAVTPAGKRMPLDVGPAENGNLTLKLGIAVPRTEEHVAAGLPARVSHYATCPQANLWRKPVKEAASPATPLDDAFAEWRGVPFSRERPVGHIMSEKELAIARSAFEAGIRRAHRLVVGQIGSAGSVLGREALSAAVALLDELLAGTRS